MTTFVLPEKWCVERTPENADKVNEWANDVKRYNGRYVGSMNHIYMYEDGSNCEFILEHYTPITTDQFLKYVYEPWKKGTVSKKEIVELPEKFCFKLDSEEAVEWATKIDSALNFKNGSYFVHEPMYDTNRIWKVPQPGYTDISSGLSEYYRVWKMMQPIPTWMENVAKDATPERKIKGYKQPVDFSLNQNWKYQKGTIWILSERTDESDFENLYTPQGEEAPYLPTEIVQTWEPVYEEEEKVWTLYNGDKVKLDNGGMAELEQVIAKYSHDLPILKEILAEMNRQKGGEK